MQIKSNQSRLLVKQVNDLVLKSFNMRMACALFWKLKKKTHIFKSISLFLKIISYDQPIFLSLHFSLSSTLRTVWKTRSGFPTCLLIYSIIDCTVTSHTVWWCSSEFRLVGSRLPDYNIHYRALINLTNAEVKATVLLLLRHCQTSSESREIKRVWPGSWTLSPLCSNQPCY